MAATAPEIVDCACGRDHETMPMLLIDFTDSGEEILEEAVCREHKRHVPCRPCLYSTEDSTRTR